jgi:hypothetical protein
MSYRLWWLRNDGMSGHVWLSEGDLALLTREMVLQGMPWPQDRLAQEEGAVVTTAEVEAALAAAATQPLSLADGKLWLDWLRFLEGSARNGGLLVRRG